MARKRRSTTELNTAENASVPKRRYTRYMKVNSNIYYQYFNILFFNFFSAQRNIYDEIIVFNHKKCLTWFHKYTNDLSDTLGIYKNKFYILFYTNL